MATLHIVHGFIGSGKTHYSTRLAESTKAIRLNADEWCAVNFSAEEQNTTWDKCFSMAIEHLWQETEKALADGKDVILDFGFWARESRDHARGKAKAIGAEVKHHYIHVPDHISFERMKKRIGPIAERNLKNFSEFKKMFEEPHPDEGAIFIKNYEEPTSKVNP